jgi:uncharacterized membrane protein
MGKKNQKKTGNTAAAVQKKTVRNLIIGFSVLVLFIAAFFMISNLTGKKPQAAQPGEGITINKSEITNTAKFIPYQSASTKMELIAVKAPDGTVRTAFNTCQVCFDSGRGYYKQQGDELICQNCGNRFNISQIEKEKNGCNPVPILSENKTENDTSITIPASFMEQNKELFGNWKRG